MSLNAVVNLCEKVVFRHRPLVLVLFALATTFFLYMAMHLKLDAAFTKNIPLNHPYMQTYLKHQQNFGGANSILIAVRDKKGNMFNPAFFETLHKVHDQLFFIPGIDRVQVKSLYSPSTRFTEVVEDGFAGGPVIPADFDEHKPADLAKVKANIEKAGIIGRLVSEDYSSAMVTAQLLDFDPKTGEKLDTIELANRLEQDIREKFQSDEVDIHIIGFAKMIGDVANGAKDVVLFFAVAIAITAVMVYLFSHSWLLTLLPLGCSLIAVIWQLGLLTVIGFGIDPMSILVPFLIFAIGVSHGVQMINAVGKQVAKGVDPKNAAMAAFRRLLVPGGIALLSDTVGFLTLLAIDIGIIRELAITASLGVAVIILTNLVLLPVLLSYAKFSPRYLARLSQPHPWVARFWRGVAGFVKPGRATVILVLAALLFVFGQLLGSKMQIGDLHAGAPALNADSRYNKDTAMITDRFAISVDWMSVITEGRAQSCTRYEDMHAIDQFQWRMENVPGVQSAISLASVAKRINAGYSEGSPLWRVIPNNTQTLVQSIALVPTTSGLLNSDCSVMPVMLFLADHKADTLARVVAAAKQYGREFGRDDLQFKLASGPAGVMAATNEAVAAAQTPMLLYVYGAVIVLCLVSFRSLRATIAVVVPLYLVSTLAQALMVKLQIGLTVSTLPVIALGVGIGVDYGIYILSTMSDRLRQGDNLFDAYLAALQERGGAVFFTGITLAIGVSTWFFSALKFQVDMGVLLTFMFLVNMLGAILLLPALMALLYPNKRA